MASFLFPMVKETSTTTGTGSYQLDGAVDGFWRFLDAFGNGAVCYYTAFDDAGGFETGWGTINASHQLARTNPVVSTNSGNAVSWGAGTRTVVGAMPPMVALADGIGTFGDGDTTPSVETQNVWVASSTGSTTITNFDDGIEGQVITISFTNSNTTIQAGSTINLPSGSNFSATSNDAISLILINGVWYQIARSVNT